MILAILPVISDHAVDGVAILIELLLEVLALISFLPLRQDFSGTSLLLLETEFLSGGQVKVAMLMGELIRPQAGVGGGELRPQLLGAVVEVHRELCEVVHPLLVGERRLGLEDHQGLPSLLVEGLNGLVPLARENPVLVRTWTNRQLAVDLVPDLFVPAGLHEMKSKLLLLVGVLRGAIDRVVVLGDHVADMLDIHLADYHILDKG